MDLLELVVELRFELEVYFLVAVTPRLELEERVVEEEAELRFFTTADEVREADFEPADRLVPGSYRLIILLVNEFDRPACREEVELVLTPLEDPEELVYFLTELEERLVFA